MIDVKCPFHIFIMKLQIENGLMTPTMKIRRERVVGRYSDQIANLYKWRWQTEIDRKDSKLRLLVNVHTRLSKMEVTGESDGIAAMPSLYFRFPFFCVLIWWWRTCGRMSCDRWRSYISCLQICCRWQNLYKLSSCKALFKYAVNGREVLPLSLKENVLGGFTAIYKKST